MALRISPPLNEPPRLSAPPWNVGRCARCASSARSCCSAARRSGGKAMRGSWRSRSCCSGCQPRTMAVGCGWARKGRETDLFSIEFKDGIQYEVSGVVRFFVGPPPPLKWSWVQFPRVTRSRAPTLEAHSP